MILSSVKVCKRKSRSKALALGLEINFIFHRFIPNTEDVPNLSLEMVV